MRWRAWRHNGVWSVGWQGERWWWSVAKMYDAAYVDLGPWRIRWAGPNHRPLFSERYGYQKWHRLGRLAVRRADRKQMGVMP